MTAPTATGPRARSTASAVARFMLGSLAAIAVVRDGSVVFRGHRTTQAPSGSFSLEKRIRNLAGADRITARGAGPNGLTCVATATLPA